MDAPPDALTLCLVASSDAVEAAVRLACPAPHEVVVFALEDVLTPEHLLSAAGEAVVQQAADAEAVLIEWDLAAAPRINTLCFHVRRSQAAPTVALCRGGLDDGVAALAAGADYAATFPLHLPTLQAMALAYRRLVRAAQQRTTAPEPRPLDVGHDVRRFGPLRLDRTAHRFSVYDTDVELTPREFALLAYLMDRPDTLCTRDQILDQVWGINFDTGTNMVDVYMYFLRRKLEVRGLSAMIQTVRGRGYRLVLPGPAG